MKIKNIIKLGRNFVLGLSLIALGINFSSAIDYEYTNLDITADIKEDGTIDILEDFTANFLVDKHGIIRDIPLNYSVAGKDFHINISNINVFGKSFKKSSKNGVVSLKIGDSYKTLRGIQNYPISYSTYGLIKNFSDMGYSELYWNLVGYDFDTSIGNVKAILYLPKIYTGFTKDDFLITTNGDCNTIDCFDGTINWSKGNQIEITYNKTLPAYQGITLAVKFPNNYFEFDHKKQKNLVGHIKSNNSDFISKILSYFQSFDFETVFYLLILFIATPLNIVLCVIYFIWQSIFYCIRKLKERLVEHFSYKFIKKGTSPIVVQYSPPEGIGPSEAGLLIDRFADPKDFTCLIYHRAAKGYIEISEITNSGGLKIKNYYNITKNLMTEPVFDTKMELDFYNNMFPHNNFQTVIGENTDLSKFFQLKDLRNLAKEKGRSKGVKKYIYIERFLFFIILLFILLFYNSNFIRFPFFSIITLIYFVYFDNLYYGDDGVHVILTKEGNKIRDQLIGFRKFIETCDKRTLKFHLSEDPLFINKILPYAVVFGLGTKFIKNITPYLSEMNLKSGIIFNNLKFMENFNHLLMEHPRYNDTDGISEGRLFYNIMSFDNFITKVAKYTSSGGFSSGSSFGGSSFSGGGGGGGGGGRSW